MQMMFYSVTPVQGGAAYRGQSSIYKMAYTLNTQKEDTHGQTATEEAPTNSHNNCILKGRASTSTCITPLPNPLPKGNMSDHPPHFPSTQTREHTQTQTHTHILSPSICDSSRTYHYEIYGPFKRTLANSWQYPLARVCKALRPVSRKNFTGTT